MNFDAIAVIGAGTMGSGIAQVAAAAGHPVKLLDVRAGAATAAIAQIDRALANGVSKGRLSGAEHAGTLARLRAVDTLAELADASLLIEVIVEDLEAKRGLLGELEDIVSPNAVLASNTSSISITAIANGLRRPQRVVGMHFFNPVPQMKLVEVVSGLDTDAAVAQAVFELAGRWGKTPVHAKSTPGFIVNRIARPYYAEALALLQDQAGTPLAIDALARGAGFRMGPCELMDLIGHDVNYAVTQSVFDANHGDRRYVPSLVQKALIDAGRLGRKVGKGFYDGVPAAAPLALHGDGPLVQSLQRRLADRGIDVEHVGASDWAGMAVQGVELHLCDGRSAARRAAERRCRDLAVIDLAMVHPRSVAIGIAFAPSAGEGARALAQQALRACGWEAHELRDAPGLWAARTLCMLVNEAADAVHQGVCDQAGADLAMKLGTHWPAGPFEWLAAIGVEHVVAVLDHLHEATRGERYRVSPLLQQQLWAGRLAAQ